MKIMNFGTKHVYMKKDDGGCEGGSGYPDSDNNNEASSKKELYTHKTNGKTYEKIDGSFYNENGKKVQVKESNLEKITNNSEEDNNKPKIVDNFSSFDYSERNDILKDPIFKGALKDFFKISGEKWDEDLFLEYLNNFSFKNNEKLRNIHNILSNIFTGHSEDSGENFYIFAKIYIEKLNKVKKIKCSNKDTKNFIYTMMSLLTLYNMLLLNSSGEAVIEYQISDIIDNIKEKYKDKINYIENENYKKIYSKLNTLALISKTGFSIKGISFEKLESIDDSLSYFEQSEFNNEKYLRVLIDGGVCYIDENFDVLTINDQLVKNIGYEKKIIGEKYKYFELEKIGECYIGEDNKILKINGKKVTGFGAPESIKVFDNDLFCIELEGKNCFVDKYLRLFSINSLVFGGFGGNVESGFPKAKYREIYLHDENGDKNIFYLKFKSKNSEKFEEVLYKSHPEIKGKFIKDGDLDSNFIETKETQEEIKINGVWNITGNKSVDEDLGDDSEASTGENVDDKSIEDVIGDNSGDNPKIIKFTTLMNTIDDDNLKSRLKSIKKSPLVFTYNGEDINGEKLLNILLNEVGTDPDRLNSLSQDLKTQNWEEIEKELKDMDDENPLIKPVENGLGEIKDIVDKTENNEKVKEIEKQKNPGLAKKIARSVFWSKSKKELNELSLDQEQNEAKLKSKLAANKQINSILEGISDSREKMKENYLNDYTRYITLTYIEAGLNKHISVLERKKETADEIMAANIDSDIDKYKSMLESIMFQSTLLYQDAIVKMNTASYIEKLIIQTEGKHQIAILTLYKEVKSCSESKSLLNGIEANKTLDAEIISHITKTNSRNRNLVKEMSDSGFSKLLDITKANVKQNQKSLIDARTKAINSREKTLSLIKEIKTIGDGTNVGLKQLNNGQTSKKIAKNA